MKTYILRDRPLRNYQVDEGVSHLVMLHHIALDLRGLAVCAGSVSFGAKRNLADGKDVEASSAEDAIVAYVRARSWTRTI